MPEKEERASFKLKNKEKRELKLDKPFFSLPNAKAGDMLITSWYGGITVRELPPTVSEMLGMNLNLAELSLVKVN